MTIIDARDSAEKIDPTSVFWFNELGVEAPTTTYYFEGGLKSLVAHYNRLQKPIHDTIFYTEKEQDNVGVEIALQYVDDMNSRIVPFANNIYNLEGGTHITGFKTALTRVINTYGRKTISSKKQTGHLLEMMSSKDLRS